MTFSGNYSALVTYCPICGRDEGVELLICGHDLCQLCRRTTVDGVVVCPLCEDDAP